MTTNAPPAEGVLAAQRRALSRLRAEAAAVRRQLAGLRRQLLQARRDCDALHATQLQQANEQLVRAALRSREKSESALAQLDALARASQIDELTHTASRALMLDRIDGALAQARRHGTRVALLFLDVDDFKTINDTRGHAAGDDALCRVAARLSASVRQSDAVGRYGGDEFLVLLPEVAGEADVASVAEKVIAALAQPPAQASATPSPSVSIGIALYPDDAQETAALIALADASMYRSKRRGGATYTFHSGHVDPQAPVDAARRQGRGRQTPSAARGGPARPPPSGEADTLLWARALNARQQAFIALQAY